jgi:hypothetical protein
LVPPLIPICRAFHLRRGEAWEHSLVAGGRGRGRPVRAAGATHVTGGFGAEHEWGCPAVRTRLEVMKLIPGGEVFGAYRGRTTSSPCISAWPSSLVRLL